MQVFNMSRPELNKELEDSVQPSSIKTLNMSTSSGKSEQGDVESDPFIFLDNSFYKQFETFPFNKFIFDKAEDLKHFYDQVREALKDLDKIPFLISNSLRETTNIFASELASYLEYCIENGLKLASNFRCLHEFIFSWERRDLEITSESHLEVIHLQWITGMLSDLRLRVKNDCKMTPSEGLAGNNSIYCRPDVCVEEKAICMEYKLEHVIGFEQEK
nr:unnamed protein product [Naegleria fowleri]